MRDAVSRTAAWGAALTVLLAAASEGSAVEEDGDRRFEGSYRLAIQPERAQERIDEAIDEAVDGMRAVRRRIGRRRLQAKNPLVRDITISRDGGNIAISLAEDRYAAPAGGDRIRVRLPDGEQVTLSHRFQRQRLEQRFEGDDGERTNLFTLSDDGTRLMMTVVITSDQLREAVRYRIPYRRR
jgi:hypothetical protein